MADEDNNTAQDNSRDESSDDEDNDNDNDKWRRWFLDRLNSIGCVVITNECSKKKQVITNSEYLISNEKDPLGRLLKFDGKQEAAYLD